MATPASSVHGIFKWFLANQTAQTEIVMYADTEYPAMQATEICSVFLSDFWGTMQSLVSDNLQLTEVHGWYSDFTIGKQPTFINVVNQQGSVSASDMLPPYCTVNVTRVPDNADISPPGNADFELGFFGVPGIVESDQDNGLLSSTAFTAWQSWADGVFQLDFNDGTADRTYTMGMYRHSETIALRTYVPCSDLWVKQKIGTRNSRKR